MPKPNLDKDNDEEANVPDGYEDGPGFTLFGEEQEVAEAFEPSNILWENMAGP